jgi:hypothetical protein
MCRARASQDKACVGSGHAATSSPRPGGGGAPVIRHSSLGRAYRPTHLAQKEEGNVLMLNEGSERWARLCSMASNVVRRWVGEELSDGVDASLLQAPESHGSIRGRAAKPGGGLGRQKCHRRRAISVEAEQWRSWRNSTARVSWAWLGLRLRFREVTGEAARCLRGGRGALGVRATDSTVKADHATDLRDPELGCKVSGRRGARG